MIRVYEKGPEQLKDIRKRLSREYTDGHISKEVFDDADESIKKLEGIILKIGQKFKK